MKVAGEMFLLVLSLLFGSYHAGADSKGHLRGIVKDPQGAVVSLTVLIVSDGPLQRQEKIAVNTDGFGKYAVALAPGQYRACAIMRGFEENCHCVQIVAGATWR